MFSSLNCAFRSEFISNSSRACKHHKKQFSQNTDTQQLHRVESFSNTKDLVSALNNTQFQRKGKHVQKQKSLLWGLLSWGGVNWMDKRHWKTFHLSRDLTGYMDTSWMRCKTSSSFFYRSSWLCSTLLDEWEPTWTFTVRAHDFMDKLGEINHIRHFERP